MKMDVKMIGGENWKNILQHVADEFGSTGVEVGITEYNGDDPDYGKVPGNEGEPEREIPEIATYAMWNEFGTSKIPMRPFMRNTIAEKIHSWSEVFQNYAEGKILVKGAVVDAWKAVGIAAKKDILETIHAGVPPENAPSTKRAKTKEALGTNEEGKTVVKGTVTKGTLIDKGNLIKSITFRVIRK